MLFRSRAASFLLLAGLAGCITGCAKGADAGKDAAGNAAAPVTVAAPAAPPPAAAPQVQPPGDDPATFAPLNSQAVKDAIHRALATGQTQRWQDGRLSGYAVPSTTTGANGCRAVRYTVDQRPDAGYDSITACDASR